MKPTNQLPGLQYVPKDKLDYQEPEAFIACTWGATTWDEFHHCTVRGVAVQLFGAQIVSDDNRCYRKAMFPDGRVMVVNEGNIRSIKVSGNGNAAINRGDRGHLSNTGAATVLRMSAHGPAGDRGKRPDPNRLHQRA
jgi:hypothetical protein